MNIDNKELREKYNPEGSTLRKAQLRMLEMLQFIDEQCSIHGIEYWIDYGTLIGAARHGGFIPWDDDTDICMTKENLEKFREVMKNNPSDRFVLQNHDTDKGYYRFWDVMRDLNSEYIHIPDMPTEHYLKYRGLQVDIFPYEENVLYAYHRFCGKFFNAFINYPLMERKHYKILKFFVPFNYGVMGNVLAPIGRFIGKLLPKKEYMMMSYGNQFVDKRKIGSIFPLKRITFEGYSFSCPNDVDDVLTCSYGDWQELPQSIKTHNARILIRD